MLKIFTFHFAEDVRALSNIWLLGDAFVRDIFSMLQSTKTKSIVSKSMNPFIYEYYNVVQLYASISNPTRLVIARIVNQMTKNLNKENKLPKYVLIFPDKDIIEFA